MKTTSEAVIIRVCEKHGLTRAEIMGQNRQRRYSVPRQELMFSLFTECPHLSLPMIGTKIGKRDHTTALHGIRAHCERNGMTYDIAKALRGNCEGSRLAEPFSVLCERYSASLEAGRV